MGGARCGPSELFEVCYAARGELTNMYDLHLNAEQIEFRDTVRDFVEKEVKPVALHPDRLQETGPRMLSEQLRQASRMGLRTLALSEELGGAGADNLTSCIVMGELAAGDVGIAAALAQTSTLAHLLFDSMTTSEQRDHFLLPFVADDSYHLAFAAHSRDVDTEWCYHRSCVSETELRSITARQDNGDWIVNGVAEFVANAPIAKLIAIQAQTGPQAASETGVRTFLVPRDTPGLTVRESDEFPLWHHGTRGAVVLKNCRIPTSDVLDEEAQALRTGVGSMGDGTLQWDAINLGVGRAAYEAALDYAKLRVQGGRRIIEHEGVGMMLAEMAVKLEAGRTMIWQAAWAADHPDARADRSLPDLPLQTLTSVFIAEIAHEVAVKASEVFGAMGILRDMPLHKYVHDALIFLDSGNGNTAAKLRIAEVLDDYQRPSVAAGTQ
jgi:alkylation response protein AidB-like acyl-CoA dehydrogenase